MVDFLRWLAGLSAEDLGKARAALAVLGDASQTVEARLNAGIDLMELIAIHTQSTLDDMAVQTLRAIQGTPIWQWVLGWFAPRLEGMVFDGPDQIFADVDDLSAAMPMQGAATIPAWAIVQACVLLWQIIRKLRS